MPDSRTGAAPDQPDEPGPWARWLVEVAEPWLLVGVEDFERLHGDRVKAARQQNVDATRRTLGRPAEPDLVAPGPYCLGCGRAVFWSGSGWVSTEVGVGCEAPGTGLHVADSDAELADEPEPA